MKSITMGQTLSQGATHFVLGPEERAALHWGARPASGSESSPPPGLGVSVPLSLSLSLCLCTCVIWDV